jgi:hypothetical protein
VTSGDNQKRVATDDDIAGMRWWNAMSPGQRALVLRSANTSVPAEAWAYHKAEYRWVESKLGTLPEGADGAGTDPAE